MILRYAREHMFCKDTPHLLYCITYTVTPPTTSKEDNDPPKIYPVNKINSFSIKPLWPVC